MAEVTKITKIYQSSKKTAALLSLAVFFCFPLSAQISNKSKNIVKKARNLSLQRDRIQASKIVREHLESNKLRQEDRDHLKRVLKKVSQMFYTAKALEEYELARSKALKNDDQALEHFEESHKLEKLNTRPIMALARFSLKRGNCKLSADWVEKALLINPYNRNLIELKLITLGCQADLEELESIKKSKPWLVREDYYYLARGQAHLLEREYDKALIELSKIKDDNIPEKHYFRGLAVKALGKKGHAKFFQKYLDLCVNKKSLEKKYPNDPRICGESEKLAQKFKLPAGETIQKVVK